jgi:hypothetical protein
MAAKTLGHLLQLVIGPLTVLTAIGARHVFIVGANDELAAAALGTNQLAPVLELGDQADMGAGEMVHEPIIGDVDRTAGVTAAPKRG